MSFITLGVVCGKKCNDSLKKKVNENVLHIGKIALIVQPFFQTEKPIFHRMPMKSSAVLNTSPER